MGSAGDLGHQVRARLGLPASTCRASAGRLGLPVITEGLPSEVISVGNHGGYCMELHLLAGQIACLFDPGDELVLV
jgi:hypothetical protein